MLNYSYNYSNLNQMLLALAAKSGTSVYENEINKINNLKANRDDKVTTLKIFKEYFDFFEFLHEGRLRPAIINNIKN